jgi:CRISPR-associated protein Cmr2
LEGRERFPARFGLSRGEQLDALGCIKRVVGKREKFPALTRMAADGWLAMLAEDEAAELSKRYESLVNLGLATRSPVERFPYDAGLLYSERLERAKGDTEAMDEKDAAEEALNDLEADLKPLWRKHGRPCPYAVLVVADGDKMGQFVDKATTEEQHRKVSAAVASFADQVPVIARAKEHGGYSVFNGGEDLTVMFPLVGVIDGARALADAFKDSMALLVQELCADDADAKPTLRVGAAICHVLEPLGVIRQWANAAEKFAKGQPGAKDQGNALGLKLHIRAGHDIGVRVRFDDADGFAALAGWQRAYAKCQVPGRLAYDTRAIALQSRALRADAAVAEGEFLRLLERARQRGGDERIPDTVRERLVARQAALAGVADSDDPGGLFRLADELILARWFSAATSSDVSALEGGK